MRRAIFCFSGSFRSVPGMRMPRTPTRSAMIQRFRLLLVARPARSQAGLLRSPLSLDSKIAAIASYSDSVICWLNFGSIAFAVARRRATSLRASFWTSTPPISSPTANSSSPSFTVTTATTSTTRSWSSTRMASRLRPSFDPAARDGPAWPRSWFASWGRWFLFSRPLRALRDHRHRLCHWPHYASGAHSTRRVVDGTGSCDRPPRRAGHTDSRFHAPLGTQDFAPPTDHRQGRSHLIGRQPALHDHQHDRAGPAGLRLLHPARPVREPHQGAQERTLRRSDVVSQFRSQSVPALAAHRRVRSDAQPARAARRHFARLGPVRHASFAADQDCFAGRCHRATRLATHVPRSSFRCPIPACCCATQQLLRVPSAYRDKLTTSTAVTPDVSLENYAARSKLPLQHHQTSSFTTQTST